MKTQSNVCRWTVYSYSIFDFILQLFLPPPLVFTVCSSHQLCCFVFFFFDCFSIFLQLSDGADKHCALKWSDNLTDFSSYMTDLWYIWCCVSALQDHEQSNYINKTWYSMIMIILVLLDKNCEKACDCIELMCIKYEKKNTRVIVVYSKC